jgi:threonine dehydrogenase-like Zn-dependent dehydrogenase
MKAWRFYGFGDMRLDDVPTPERRHRHVLAQVLCVQPSVTEAQLAAGIPTLAFERIKKRLETEVSVQLFGHEFCVRIIEVGEGVTRVGLAIVSPPEPNSRAKLVRCVCPVNSICAEGGQSSVFSCRGVFLSTPYCRRLR